MNVLPFVLTFLFIFGMFSLSYLENYKSFHSLQQSYLSSMEALRACRNEQELRNYKKNKKTTGKQKGNKQKEEEKKKNITSIYDRDKYFGTRLSKVNLSSLLQDTENETLYLVALRYFQQIYGATHFIKDEKFAKKIFDAFLTQAKSKWLRNNKVCDFYELYPEDPTLHYAYYKILKGTQNYEVSKGVGYPPLSDLFILESPLFTTKAIHFYHIPYRLLEILYGEKIMERIKEAEATKRSTKVVPQAEIEKILHSDPNPKQTLINDLLSYKYDRELMPRIFSTNKITRITIKF